MNIACVIGNGPSRKELDLHCINATMTTYGCNALYRDFMPNYLISMDILMVCEIIDNRIHHQTKFYTQHHNKLDKLAEEGEPINFCKIQRETHDSGNSALRLALENRHETIYVIGFDYSSDPSSLPNVYTGTNNYQKSYVWPAASMTDTKWIQRLRKILKDYPDQQVVRVNGTRKLDIENNNYSEITPKQFKEIYDSTN
jgi:hypothetical protein